MSTEASATDDYTRRVEAVLFAAAEPLSPADIRTYAGEGDLGSALETLVAAHCWAREQGPPW